MPFAEIYLPVTLMGRECPLARRLTMRGTHGADPELERVLNGLLRILAIVTVGAVLGGCSALGLDFSALQPQPDAVTAAISSTDKSSGAVRTTAETTSATMAAPLPARAVPLVNLGRRAQGAGNLILAASAFQSAMKLAPDHPLPVMALARVLYDSGNYADAALRYEDVLRLDPDNAHAWQMRGMAYLRAGRLADARSSLERALALREDARIYNALGVVADSEGDRGLAQAYYRLGLQVAPQWRMLKSNLGLSLALSGRPQEALPLLAELAEGAEAGRRERQNYVLALAMAGMREKALALARADLSPDQAVAVIHRYEGMARRIASLQ